MDIIQPESGAPSIQVAVRTLTISGFTLDDATRNPGYALLYAHRFDEFGNAQRYCFALCETMPESQHVEAARTAAQHHKSELVVIAPLSSHDSIAIDWSRFLSLLGGPVYDYLPLEPGFDESLKQLAFNSLPTGLLGRPDDLFELYVHKALEFVFACKVRRYGQERRFEARPDGIVLQGTGFSALYDAKAYSDGYDVTLDSLRQFHSYVTEFASRYRQYVDLHAFIVVSGGFVQSQSALEEKARQFLALSRVPLAFLTADVLSQVKELLSAFPAARHSINWRKIFVNAITQLDQVEAELRLLKKDNIIKAPKE